MKKFTGMVLWLVAAAAYGVPLQLESPVQVEAYAIGAGVGYREARVSRQVTVMVEPGGVSLTDWAVPGVRAPTAADLLPVPEAEAVVEAARQARAVAAQAAKPAARKAAENQYFELTRTVLAAVGDPRADDVPTPKLGFAALGGLIRTLQGSDPMTALVLSVELLSVDAELKRYALLWWDDVQEHAIED